MRTFIQKIYVFLYRYRNLRFRFSKTFSIVSLFILLFWVFTFKNTVLDANNIPTGSMIPTLKIGDFLFVNKMRYTINLPIPFVEVPIIRIDKPKLGDIVTFRPPNSAGLSGKVLVKRIVGLPGDVLTVVNNQIFINSVPYFLDELNKKDILYDLVGEQEDYYSLYKETMTSLSTGEEVEHYIIQNKHVYNSDYRSPKKTFIIPDNKYMVMGDNRDNSDDSRRWGFVDLDRIYGKVFMCYFSVNWGDSSYHKDYFGKNFINPVNLLIDWMKGEMPGAYVRWSRIGKRIF